MRFAILFGCSVAFRAEGNGILRLPRLEVPRDAKINQVHVVVGGAHDIRRLEVAKDNGRLVGMQVVEHRTQLDTDFKNHLNREELGVFAQVVFQGIARDKVHHHVGAPLLAKMIVNARQVRVGETRQQQRFMFKGSGGLGQFL